MDRDKIFSAVDHTALAQDATWEQVKELCDQALKFHTASVCIPPSYVARAKEYLGERMAVCTVIGFPNGYQTRAVKAFETRDAIANGADEIDMVINIGAVKDKNWDFVRDDIKAVVEASKPAIVKVIIETCLLTDEEKVKACQLSEEAGAAFVKTSTGFSTGGATLEDIRLMRRTVGDRLQVKASGGIRTPEFAKELVEAGADRIGAGNGIVLL